MRALELPAGADWRTWGRVHGESFAGEIRSLAEIRIYLTCKVGGFPNERAVLACAREHLPVLRDYHAGLYDELCGIAEGAATTPEQIVVLNHYTDLRDLDPDPAQRAPAVAGDPDGGCSVVYARTADGPVLAQTWDMHATAIPYAMMLRVPSAADTPGAWLLTLTGCLGMAGLNQHGLGIAINNLHSTDARVGVVWPALVRRCLHERTAARARDIVLATPIGSGHHYLVADPDAAFGIETSGVRRRVIYHGEEPVYVHTNHCLDDAIGAVSRVPPTSTTRDRYRWLTDSVAARAPEGLHDLWRRLGSHDGYPRSVCTNMATPENPHGTATCSAIALELSRKTAWAAGGFIHNVAPERFRFGEAT